MITMAILLSPLFASAEPVDIYERFLQNEEQKGNINSFELQKHKFELDNNKMTQEHVKKTARNIASVFKENKKTIKLHNPEIVIPIK